MSKKWICALLFAAAVATVAVVACKKESEYDKGVKDGKAVCNCLKGLSATATQEQKDACGKKVNQNSKNEDYQKGVMVGVMSCSDLLGGWSAAGE